MVTIPAVSVVITAYNIENYVIPCVNSILRQTMQDFEIVLIDDCSTDHTFEICKHLAASNEKIRAFQRKTNGGAGAARNTGMINAHGKYIYFVDGDDLMLPNGLEIMFKAAEESNADVVHSSTFYQIEDEDLQAGNLNEMRIFGDMVQEPGFLTENTVERVIRNWGYGETCLMIWLNLYNRDFLISNEIRFPEIIAEDMLFAFTDVAFAKKYFKIPQSIYLHRIRKGSLSNGNPSKKVDYSGVKKSIKSFVDGTKYIEKLLNRLPAFSTNKNLKEQVMILSLSKFLYPGAGTNYDENGNMNEQYYDSLTNGFEQIFGENAFFVKYLFNHFNIFFLRNKNLVKEVSELQQKLKNIEEGGGYLIAA